MVRLMWFLGRVALMMRRVRGASTLEVLAWLGLAGLITGATLAAAAAARRVVGQWSAGYRRDVGAVSRMVPGLSVRVPP
jgi:hypothetical protein